MEIKKIEDTGCLNNEKNVKYNQYRLWVAGCKFEFLTNKIHYFFGELIF